MLRSTRLNPAERCRPQPKPCGFGRLRLPAGFAGKARKSGEPAPGAQAPKCQAVPFLLRSTRLNPAERCRPQPKPCGFGRLRLPAGFTGKARKSGEPAPGAQAPKCQAVPFSMDLVSEEQRTTAHAHNTLDFPRTKSLLFLVGWCLLHISSDGACFLAIELCLIASMPP